MWLGDRGISVEEVRVIPDKKEAIIKTVNDLRTKHKMSDNEISEFLDWSNVLNKDDNDIFIIIGLKKEKITSFSFSIFYNFLIFPLE